MSIIQLAESFGLSDGGELKGVTNEAHRRLSPARAKALKEAGELWGKAWAGDRMAALVVNEALTTSDLFKSATGDLLDRELLAVYGDIPSTWDQFASRTTVRNFKPKKLVDIMGGRTALDLVPELTEYPYADSDSNEYEVKAKKFGRRFGFSWEAGVNDDIDELRQIPSRFGTAAQLTEERAALEALVTVSSGAPLTSFFKKYDATAAGTLGYSAFDNSSTAALTSAALEAGITSITGRKDKDGNVVPNAGLVRSSGSCRRSPERPSSSTASWARTPSASGRRSWAPPPTASSPSAQAGPPSSPPCNAGSASRPTGSSAPSPGGPSSAASASPQTGSPAPSPSRRSSAASTQDSSEEDCMNPVVKLFGREPAAWVGLIEAALILLLAFFTLMTPEQLTLVMAAVNALAGCYVAWATKDTMLGVVVGLAKAILALVIGFGLALTEPQTAAILGFVVIIGSFFNRQNTYPLADPPRAVPGALPVSDVGSQ